MTGSWLSPPDRDLPGDHSAGAQQEPHENGRDYRDHERPQASDSVEVQTNHFSSRKSGSTASIVTRAAAGLTKSDALAPPKITEIT